MTNNEHQLCHSFDASFLIIICECGPQCLKSEHLHVSLHVKLLYRYQIFSLSVNAH